MVLVTHSSLFCSRRLLHGAQAGAVSQLCRKHAFPFSSSGSNERIETVYKPIISTEVPPESPRYIHIPEPPQPQIRVRRGQKGVLPRPRDIPFKRGNKTSDEYLNRATPEPSHKPIPEGLSHKEKDYIDYKTRQSVLRRQNLREGIRELHQRKRRIDNRRASIQGMKRATYESKVNAPEREDERLTKSSILPFMLPGALRIKPDPNWEAKLAERKERFHLKQEAKMEERHNALHTLYMNAKDFIVTEVDLIKKVDEEFDKQFYKDHPDRGIWDEEGMPETAQWMLAQAAGRGSNAADTSKGYVELSRERVQRIAEELTGGKM